MSLGDHPSNEASERFLPTTICYAEEISAMARGSSNGNLNTEVYMSHIHPKLFLDISQANGELHAKNTFSVNEISKELALGMLHTFNKAIAAVVSSPFQSLGMLDLCSEHDRQLLQKYTESVSESYEVLLHALALQHAHLTPDAPAIHSWDDNLTYAQRDDATSRLGQSWPGWAAGAAYISVDATDPPMYLENVIRRVNARIILTSEAYRSRYASFVPSVIAVTPDMVRALPVSTGIICPWVKPSDVCLVLFTSGSTGEPKGIIQEHRAYATAVRDYNKLLGLGRHSRVLQFDDYAFDISNNDYLTTVAAGGCCCVHTPTKSVPTLVENINTLQVDTTFLTPTIAAQISPQDVPTLELLCLGGEPVPNELLIRLVAACETGESVWDGGGGHLNAIVGRAGSGAIWITSPESPEFLMPVGAVGEILIEGPHLARGYLDSVCQKPGVGFLPNAPTWLKDLHPSGDLGRYTHAGTVEHLGRKDTLLKINGYRVEATEVEHILRQVVNPQGRSHPRTISTPLPLTTLWQFLPVTSQHSAHQVVQRMKAEVMATLPVHKIPEYFILLSQIPRTRSNEADRRKLHHLAQESYVSGALSKICNK
ncbi:AMP-binding enzyme, putative [Aspergillus fumigatus A1163]|uniref:AMP-binding enzyme, putative n=1 Tax=Aspergillus fumigatus (strain CBS 144.89 / FGSC A1163 / CEA10) TaxID=451804 RepID=B0Y580_ASPFC|nr:AMP-binding enzyme, putative [Aspergillus fumigatus A1163]